MKHYSANTERHQAQQQRPYKGLTARFKRFTAMVATIATLTLTSATMALASNGDKTWRVITATSHDRPETACYIESGPPINLTFGFTTDGMPFAAFFPSQGIEAQLTEDYSLVAIVTFETGSNSVGPFAFDYNENRGDLSLTEDYLENLQQMIASEETIFVNVKLTGASGKHLFVVNSRGGAASIAQLEGCKHNATPSQNTQKRLNKIGNSDHVLSATCLAYESSVYGKSATGFGGTDKVKNFNLSVRRNGVVTINGQTIKPKYWEHSSNGDLIYTGIAATDVITAIEGKLQAAQMMPNVSQEDLAALQGVLQGFTNPIFGNRERIFLINTQNKAFAFGDIVNSNIANIAHAKCG